MMNLRNELLFLQVNTYLLWDTFLVRTLILIVNIARSLQNYGQSNLTDQSATMVREISSENIFRKIISKPNKYQFSILPKSLRLTYEEVKIYCVPHACSSDKGTSVGFVFTIKQVEAARIGKTPRHYYFRRYVPKPGP